MQHAVARNLSGPDQYEIAVRQRKNNISEAEAGVDCAPAANSLRFTIDTIVKK